MISKIKIRITLVAVFILLASSTAMYMVNAGNEIDPSGDGPEIVVLPTIYYGDGPYTCTIHLDTSDYPETVYVQTICKTTVGSDLLPPPGFLLKF